MSSLDHTLGRFPLPTWQPFACAVMLMVGAFLLWAWQAELDQVVRKGCADFDFHAIYQALNTFCAVDLSAFYFDVRKDSLYCDHPDSIRRRACRSVLDRVFSCLTAWLAPILCFTAEEAWLARGGGPEESVHLRVFPEINIIYGSVTLIVLFLLALFAFWVVVILGVEVSYIAQNFHALKHEYLSGLPLDDDPCMVAASRRVIPSILISGIA